MTDYSVRHDWTRFEVEALFKLPFFELARRAQELHAAYHDPNQVQLCTLSNIKRGGCPEDCAYCPQSAHHSTGLKAEPLSPVDEVLAQARLARNHGASRFCMGAAWKKVRDGKAFDQVLDMVSQISDMGMEVCVTLGMLNDEQAERLAHAGLTAYNHNIDTSPEFYDQIISTRSFQDRLDTLASVRNAGITVCSGGIVGLGESQADRASMLRVLANLEPHPESVPINKLVHAEGTPLADTEAIDDLEFLRTIAVCRIMMPASMVRLAAGRRSLSKEGRILAFMLGANSIFYGDELLTTANPSINEDRALMDELGMRPLDPRIRRLIPLPVLPGARVSAK
jgi:biotin synthase